MGLIPGYVWEHSHWTRFGLALDSLSTCFPSLASDGLGFKRNLGIKPYGQMVSRAPIRMGK